MDIRKLIWRDYRAAAAFLGRTANQFAPGTSDRDKWNGIARMFAQLAADLEHEIRDGGLK